MPCRRDKNLLGLVIIDLVSTLCSKNLKATILDIWVNLQEGSNVWLNSMISGDIQSKFHRVAARVCRLVHAETDVELERERESLSFVSDINVNIYRRIR